MEEKYAAAASAQAPWPWPFAAWSLLTRAGAPLLGLHLRRRVRMGREDADRLGERRGRASQPRPPGRLIWIHAASVGETLSVLPLMARLATDHAILATTTTLTAQRLLAERAGAAVTAQYAPFDTPGAVARFLDHWRPDAALFLESELWPNQLRATAARGAKLALVNARLSPRSAARWSRAPRSAARLLGVFDIILAQSAADVGRFTALGGAAEAAGNLKFSAAPPAPDAALARARPAWLAASLHPEDAPAFAAAHAAIRAATPDALLILAPRHPEKARAIVSAMGLDAAKVAWRSDHDAPPADCAVFVVDRLGELDRWAAQAQMAAMGGGFSGHGGHNPIEPARTGAALILPPGMTHFENVAVGLTAAGGAIQAQDAAGFAQAGAALMTDDEDCARRGAAACAWAAAEAAGVLDRVEARLRAALSL